ncbi:MAG: hypothetical protein ACJ8J0_27910, partial [Longimicrobiaceae bacterium]
MAKAIMLVDNFNDNVQDLTKWFSTTDDRVREVNGRVELRPPSNQAGTFGYVSPAIWDFTESAVHLEVIRTLRASPSAFTWLGVFVDSANYILIRELNGQLECIKVVAGTLTRLRAVPYDRVAHRWLRLSEQGGITFWQVSSDGVDWTTLYQAPDPIVLTTVLIEFGVWVTAP